jgi:hypothetical protein
LLDAKDIMRENRKRKNSSKNTSKSSQSLVIILGLANCSQQAKLTRMPPPPLLPPLLVLLRRSRRGERSRFDELRQVPWFSFVMAEHSYGVNRS